MQKRTAAVTFKGNPMTLVGPQLKAGDKAPDFKVAKDAGSTVSLADTPAKARIFSVVPSLDTPVCSTQTKTFDKGLAELGDKVAAYTVSLDTPFAQKRFCGEAEIKTMQTLSDQHDGSFGKNFGVLLEGLAVPLLARAVFVVDKGGKVTHAEYVAEVTHEPNYATALAALKAAA
ncbi:MAG TPA: thiol peroxidase [Gemmataceae bacterium]|jgi:thiol peroxidase|nr:thiol peroxidase [Gemmataceae bacterium]